LTPPTTAESPAQIRVCDPLSDVTRRERRALLGISLLGITIASSGLIPKEIEALGVKFSTSDQRALLMVLAAVTAYFLVAFLIYAASDFLTWRLSLKTAVHELMKTAREQDEYDKHIEQEIDDNIRERYPSLHVSHRMVIPVSRMRATFEFLVPLLVGLCAIIVLLRAHVT